MGFVRNRLPDAVHYFESEGLTFKGRGKWRSTLCPFHDDSDPSMRVNVETGAWVCMSCGAKGGDVLAFHMERHGVDFITAAKALGCWDDDGRPAPVRPASLPPRAALEVLHFEALLTAVAAGNLAQGVTLSDDDRARLRKAAGRILLIAQEAHP